MQTGQLIESEMCLSDHEMNRGLGNCLGSVDHEMNHGLGAAGPALNRPKPPGGELLRVRKSNFRFERVICDWRTRVTVLDLRLKK